MKRPVIYLHGGDSFSRHEDFLNYLRTVPIREPRNNTQRPQRWTDVLPTELGSDFEVYMPSMPNKHNARYEEWQIWFERYLELVEEGVVLIGWSLGGMFLAKYLSESRLNKSVHAVYILAAPGGDYAPQDGSGVDCYQFRPQAATVATIALQVPRVEFWHSEDDFVVPATELTWYANHVPGAKVRLFRDKNHFLVEELPELVEEIRSFR